jgi:hypothetical protein
VKNTQNESEKMQYSEMELFVFKIPELRKIEFVKLNEFATKNRMGITPINVSERGG